MNRRNHHNRRFWLPHAETKAYSLTAGPVKPRVYASSAFGTSSIYIAERYDVLGLQVLKVPRALPTDADPGQV